MVLVISSSWAGLGQSRAGLCPLLPCNGARSVINILECNPLDGIYRKPTVDFNMAIDGERAVCIKLQSPLGQLI